MRLEALSAAEIRRLANFATVNLEEGVSFCNDKRVRSGKIMGSVVGHLLGSNSIL